jgi:ABC-type Na+ transport system ATPase subunit NatA
MTGKETLLFYGNIRGIPSSVLSRRVEELLVATDLVPHALLPAGKYSGGNKRKLSLAIALISDPRILILDEVRASLCILSLFFYLLICLVYVCFPHSLVQEWILKLNVIFGI